MYDASERWVQENLSAVQTMDSAAIPATPWPEMPIPDEQVVEGRPDARGLVVHQTPDQLVSSGFWQCSPSKFTWEFTWDEFVCVIEGRVTISDNHGNTLTLGPGDVASFAKGLSTTWHVQEQVRKFFVIRTSESLET